MSENKVIDAKGVYKYYDKTCVLDGVDLSVEQGDFFGFTGVNGAGKSTLVKCMLSYCYFEKGQISIQGVDSSQTQSRAHVAFLPERFVPPYFLSGGQFLEMMLGLYRVPYDLDKIKQLLTDLDLDHKVLNMSVKGFSKGMTQKIGLAACLLSERSVLILDEPMSGLDPKARALVKRQFRKLKEKGQTLFFTSHMLADVEEICSTMAILHGNQIRYFGTPAGLQAEYQLDSLEECYLRKISE